MVATDPCLGSGQLVALIPRGRQLAVPISIEFVIGDVPSLPDFGGDFFAPIEE
jgi:hypothetical protein